ncbi:hypothetical protein Tco_0435211 [Tanacetum coccineum]
MHTRSQTRNLQNQQHQAPPAVVEPFNLENPFENPPPPPPPPMVDKSYMAQFFDSTTPRGTRAFLYNGSTEDVPPPVVPVVYHESISEPANTPVSASKPNQKASIPFPSRRNDERRREKANDTNEKSNSMKFFRDLVYKLALRMH